MGSECLPCAMRVIHCWSQVTPPAGRELTHHPLFCGCPFISDYVSDNLPTPDAEFVLQLH